MTDPHKTIDPRTLGKLNPPEQGISKIPCVEILYHYDLERVGLVTAPSLFMSGRQVVFGRENPAFVSIDGTYSHGGLTLSDPCVSRHQSFIKWIDHLGCFEIQASQSARRPVCEVRRSAPKGGGLAQASFHKIEGSTLIEPGTMVAFGDRVLLLLDCRPYRADDLSRLGMVGEHKSVWRARDEITRAARFKKPVLVRGETGTGKELAAQAIHNESDRCDGPFLIVNCGALPESLVESVLFGHKKGAFTGATTDSPGLFRGADGGSLFLDEIGELPLQMQHKLLRALQDGTIMPVGEFREQQVDVRVIAATNRDLAAEVEAGRFRQDLFYRLSAHIIELPPLRQRNTDAPRLFLHFLNNRRDEHDELKRLWRRVDAYVPPVPMSFFADLLVDDWPGNVRQLQNVVEMTARVNLCTGPFVTPDWRTPPSPANASLSPEAPETVDVTPMAPPPETIDGVNHDGNRDIALSRVSERIGLARLTLGKLISPAEYDRLSRTTNNSIDALVSGIEDTVAGNFRLLMERFDYNQTHASKELSVSRTTLQKVMMTLGFPRPKDLSSEVIESAMGRAAGDVEAAARILRVSTRGLRLRIRELGL